MTTRTVLAVLSDEELIRYMETRKPRTVEEQELLHRLRSRVDADDTVVVITEGEPWR